MYLCCRLYPVVLGLLTVDSELNTHDYMYQTVVTLYLSCEDSIASTCLNSLLGSASLARRNKREIYCKK